MNWLSFLGRDTNPELPDIFPLPILQKDFVRIDVQNIYSRILTDVFERMENLPQDADVLLADSCLMSQKQEGLITMVACAMTDKTDLFLVYDKSVNLIIRATPEQESQIKKDYALKAESPVGVYISFRKYQRTDMVKFYSMLEYCAVGGLWKQANISKAIQLKFSDLRTSTGLADKADIKAQAQTMAKGLADGKDIMGDAKDIIETLTPDMTATNATTDFINCKRSFYLGMPANYLSGEQTKAGIGDSGYGDMRSIERGLSAYFASIAKPIADSLFGVKTTFRSDDNESLDTAINVLKTMDITSDEYLGKENKTKIVNRAFGLDENEVGDEVKQPTTTVVPNGSVQQTQGVLNGPKY